MNQYILRFRLADGFNLADLNLIKSNMRIKTIDEFENKAIMIESDLTKAQLSELFEDNWIISEEVIYNLYFSPNPPLPMT